MNRLLIVVFISLSGRIVDGFSVLPQLNTPDKNFQSEFSNQNMHTVLQSIENRLQNMEGTLTMQYTSLVEGKLEYYGRKIENIEKDLTRFEAHMRIEIDKVLENISNKIFKDDILKDRTLRKIDGIYERINHKLSSIEGQIDAANMKSQNTRETTLSKLEKIEENLTTRDGDMEAEIADAAAAIDDLKTTCTNIEENFINVTRDSLRVISKNNEKSLKKHSIQISNMLEEVNKSISADMIQLQIMFDHTLNQSLITHEKITTAKIDLDESMNEYANKITNMYSDLWKKTDVMANTVQNLALVTNMTRNEQQNGLRALMVQVGRKTAKNVPSDSMIDNQKLTELIKKVDSNFENVMMAQNLFLESCHRVQMDESQLESQISIVLDKLIDTFQNKTAIGPKDIKHLEHLIRSHDSHIKKSIYHITNHLLNLIQKNSDNKDEIVDYIKSELLHLEALHMMVHDALNIKDSEQMNNILQELQGLQQAINKTHASLERTNTMNFHITKILNTSESNKQVNYTKLDEVLNYVKNISLVLNSIETTINKSYLHLFLKKYNNEIIVQQFGKWLKEYMRWMTGNQTTNTTQENITDLLKKPANMNKLLLVLFDTTLYNFSNSAEQNNSMGENPYIENVQLCNSEHNNTNCGKLHLSTDQGIQSGCLPDYINEIDGRNNDQNCSNNSSTNEQIPYKQNISNTGSDNCLLNYIDLINVKSNIPTNCSFSKVLNQINTTLNHTINNLLNDYHCSNCTQNVTNIEKSYKQTHLNNSDARQFINQNYTILISTQNESSNDNISKSVHNLDTNIHGSVHSNTLQEFHTSSSNFQNNILTDQTTLNGIDHMLESNEDVTTEEDVSTITSERLNTETAAVLNNFAPPETENPG